MKRQIELSNEAAVALNDTRGEILAELEQISGCDIHVRGNLVTLEGDEAGVSAAAERVAELAALVDQGHELTDASFATIGSELERLYATLVEHGLAAGSASARRLFS